MYGGGVGGERLGAQDDGGAGIVGCETHPDIIQLKRDYGFVKSFYPCPEEKGGQMVGS